MVGDLLDKREMRNEKRTNNHSPKFIVFNFLNFLFFNNIIMASYIKNLLKQLPFYEKTIKPRIKKFTNAKLLSELPFFEKPIKAKIKQLTTKKLLQEQPFHKKSIKNHVLKS